MGFTMMKQEVDAVREYVHLTQEKVDQEISGAQAGLQAQIQEATAERNELHQQLMDDFQSQTDKVRGEMEQERYTRGEIKDLFDKHLNEEIPRLKTNLRQEWQKREDMEQKLLQFGAE